MTLALLITAVGGAWAEETLLLTIESKNYTSFWSGSKTFDDKVTITFSNPVNNEGDSYGWYSDSNPSLLTVAGTNGYTITSCKFYTYTGPAKTGYTVAGESPSVYLDGGYVYTDNSKSAIIGAYGVTKIEVYTAAASSATGPEPIELKPDDTGKKWILADMPAYDVELQVEYEPTKVTLAANDKTMGTVEVGGESKVEWTTDTWQGWTQDTKTYTVGDITITGTQSTAIYEYPQAGGYFHSLSFFVNEHSDDASVTFSTTGTPFTRIEFAMIDDYNPGNGQTFNGFPNIQPADGWTFEGKSAVWEGEATKSLTLKSCSTWVSKITFFQGGVPEGVTVNTDGTFTVAKTATVTVTATPKEGYKFLYWADDQTNTNPVREVTIEPGEADMTLTAVFAEPTYNVTFVKRTNLNEWTATPNTEVKKDTKVNINYTGTKKVLGVKAAKKVLLIVNPEVGQIIGSDGKNYDANATLPDGVTAVAKICYVGSETGDEDYTNGLALALSDKGSMNWSTATGASGAAAHTPAAPTTTSSWMLPSQDQWNKMINAAGGYTALRDGFSGITGASNLMPGTYWSSTEVDSSRVWRYYFGSGGGYWSRVSKDSDGLVRACLAF